MGDHSRPKGQPRRLPGSALLRELNDGISRSLHEDPKWRGSHSIGAVQDLDRSIPSKISRDEAAMGVGDGAMVTLWREMKIPNYRCSKPLAKWRRLNQLQNRWVSRLAAKPLKYIPV